MKTNYKQLIGLFKSIRMAYIDDLVLPPPPHDFEVFGVGADDGKGDSEDLGQAIIGNKNILMRKGVRPLRFVAVQVWHSQSLNVSVYSQSRVFTPEQMDLILTWIYENWATKAPHFPGIQVPLSMIPGLGL